MIQVGALMAGFEAMEMVGTAQAMASGGRMPSGRPGARGGVTAGPAAATARGAAPDLLFHGTDAASADAIARNGISKAAARELGGGDVFWTTPMVDTARFFANANPAGGPPGVVGIRLPPGALDSMKAAGVVGVDQTGAVKVFNWKVFNGSVEFFRFE
jgi:hypothetical protein